MIQKKVFALLVSEEDESSKTLKNLLKNHGIEIWTARTCEEAARLMDQTHPELVFTSTMLCDGTWSDVVRLAEKTLVPMNVIVVGRCKDTQLYLSTLDFGAFDFILPPFEAVPIAFVARVAAENARRRREEQTRKAVA